MKTTIATAAFLGIASADGLRKGYRPSNRNGGLSSHGGNSGDHANQNGLENRFNAWAARYNQESSSAADWEAKLNRFGNSAQLVDDTNAKASGSDDLRLELNAFAAMTDEEFKSHTGLAPEVERRATSFPLRHHGKGKGRHLSHAAVTVDHHADGFMHPVKNQGGCGSCWAFAANTALEGTIAKKTGTFPGRFSEQQLVDCTLRQNQRNIDMFGKDYGLWGCGGGWMSIAWDFQKEQGIMMDADYPYTSGNTGTETACAHDYNKTVGKVSSYH